jgi:hypothetical protein
MLQIEMTISEIKYNAQYEKIELLSRQIVLGGLLPVKSISKTIEEMKDTAEIRENENQDTSISSAYTLK